MSATSPRLFRAAADARTPKVPNDAFGWVGSKLKSYYEALIFKLERAGQSDMEAYLAASQNLADLEERIRQYQRRPSNFF